MFGDVGSDDTIVDEGGGGAGLWGRNAGRSMSSSGVGVGVSVADILRK